VGEGLPKAAWSMNLKQARTRAGIIMTPLVFYFLLMNAMDTRDRRNRLQKAQALRFYHSQALRCRRTHSPERSYLWWPPSGVETKITYVSGFCDTSVHWASVIELKRFKALDKGWHTTPRFFQLTYKAQRVPLDRRMFSPATWLFRPVSNRCGFRVRPS
jgi:hypothetical protein